MIEVKKIGEGRVLVSRGETLFPVTYTALVFRPVKNEVVDAIVSTVTKVLLLFKEERTDGRKRGCMFVRVLVCMCVCLCVCVCTCMCACVRIMEGGREVRETLNA